MIHAHSGLRWLVLALLIVAIIKALLKLKKNDYQNGDRMIYLFTMVSVHIQITLGIIVSFISGKISYSEGWMKNPQLRFFGMEHISLMVLAAIFVTIGHSKSKKASEANKKHKFIAIFYALAFILIVAAIPWPFRNLGGKWF